MIFCIIILIIMGMFPIITSVVSEGNQFAPKKETYKTSAKITIPSDIDTDIIISEAYKLSKTDYCEETLKAILVIAENNLQYNINNKIHINTKEADKSDKLYKKLESLYKEADVKINYKNECVFIPTASLSKGHTKTSEDFPYLSSVASPWDCENKNYIYNKEYPCGISIGGIDYLCKEGMNYTEALKWYLPDFEIKEKALLKEEL